MASSDSADVLILGGGFAGLACATALAEAGLRVSLLEKKPHLGGRAYSFKDPGTGEIVDNGQHLFMGCYRQTRVFLRRIGAEPLLRFPRGVRIQYADRDGGRDRLDCPAWLPAPLHVGWGIAGLSGVSWPEKAKLRSFDRFMRDRCLNGGMPAELDRLTVRQWLDSLGQPRRLQERLFDPIALGALNELPERASALGLAQVLREVFYRDEESSRLGLPVVGLSELYTGQSESFIRDRGGKVFLNRKVRAVRESGGRITAVETDLGEVFTAGTIVSSLPPWALDSVERPQSLRGSWSELRPAPILGVHLWLDRPVVREPVVGLLGTELHWVFNKTKLWNRPSAGQYLSLVISGAHRRVGASPEELLGLARADMARCFPGFEKATINAWRVIKEPYATPSLGCGSDALRPAPVSPVPNFLYAGDWTQTGLPGTIESASASGHACARLILGGK